MNFEDVVKITGWSGYQFDIFGLIIGLLPYRLWVDFLTRFDIHPLPLIEPTAGTTGFIGGLFWYVGLWGMLAFCFFIGIVCKYFYINSQKSLFCLLIYAQISWTLIAAHTYNHFFNLIYIPAPAIVFFLLSMLVRPRIATKVNHIKCKRNQNEKESCL